MEEVVRMEQIQHVEVAREEECELK